MLNRKETVKLMTSHIIPTAMAKQDAAFERGEDTCQLLVTIDFYPEGSGEPVGTIRLDFGLAQSHEAWLPMVDAMFDAWMDEVMALITTDIDA